MVLARHDFQPQTGGGHRRVWRRYYAGDIAGESLTDTQNFVNPASVTIYTDPNGRHCHWRAPIRYMHTPAGERAAVVATHDHAWTNSATTYHRVLGTGMLIERHALSGENVVRVGARIGVDPKWGKEYWGNVQIFLDVCDPSGTQRRTYKLRYANRNGDGTASEKWFWMGNVAGADAPIEVPIPIDQRPTVGSNRLPVIMFNEHKANGAIVEMDIDLDSGKLLGARLGPHLLGHRRDPADTTLEALAAPVAGNLPDFAYGENFCVEGNNRVDGAPWQGTPYTPGSIYRSRFDTCIYELWADVIS